MTNHIRWHHDSGGRIIGCVGTLEPSLFTLAPPLDDSGGEHHSAWLLMSRLPGQESVTIYDEYPESLTERAEELLANFVSSLGAVFPDQTPPAGEEGVAMMIPVRIPADLKPVLASERRYPPGRGHLLDPVPCPVCESPLGTGVVVLVFAGIAPGDRKGGEGRWTTGGAVAVHATCAGVPETEPDTGSDQ